MSKNNLFFRKIDDSQFYSLDDDLLVNYFKKLYKINHLIIKTKNNINFQLKKIKYIK